MAEGDRRKFKLAWLTCLLPLALFALASFPAAAQNLATLQGTVRDSWGQPLAGATLILQRKDAAETATAHSDLQGKYAFAAVPPGVYSLHATKAGRKDRDVFSFTLAAGEHRNIDVAFEEVRPIDIGSVAGSPQFFDQPQFTVSGITDTTSLGGHGSDTVVRARESLAKETVVLGKPPASHSSESLAAEKSLRERVERDPEDFDANHRLGQLLIESGKAGEAIPYLQRAEHAKAGDYENAYDLALANAQAGNYESARDGARLLLAGHEKAELHHLLGDIEEKSGNSLDAVHQYQRAAEMLPSETYLFDWGSELLLHHAAEPALEVFSKANKLFPGSARILIGLGSALFALGSYEQAALQICEASDLNPSDPVPYLFLGKMQSAENLPSEAVLKKMRRFATLQPQNPEANYYYAVALWKQRDPHDKSLAAEAEASLNNSIRLDAKFAPAELQLGIVRAEQGDYSGAILHYDRAVKIDPQMEDGHYRLAQAYRQLGQVDKSKEELRIYQALTKQSSQQLERERHEIRQFVYTLRDQPASQIQ